MKIKAKKTYAGLNDTDNFNSLASASTHLRLLAGLTCDWNGKIPKKLKEHITEIKTTKGGKK